MGILTKEDDVEIHALARRGWPIAAIARHTSRDRKTVRRYLTDQARSRERAPSVLEPYRAYLVARFKDDAHVPASVLMRELSELGFERSYPTLVRELRRLELRPSCRACRAGRSQVTTELDHEPGEELQLDWLELRETPWGETAYVLVGALSYSGRIRAVFQEGMTFAHLVDALDGVLRRLGATTRSWRTDRMATVVNPGTGRLRKEFAEVAKHYGTTVAICPANRPQRKGVVEAAVGYLQRSWWRSAPVKTLAQAQVDLDRFTAAVADRRKRGDETVASLADKEPLLTLPASPFPAVLEAERVVSRSALVAFEGNSYSVVPGLVGQRVIVRARLGDLYVEIYSHTGQRMARHRRQPQGAGQTVRSEKHAQALEREVLEAFTTRSRCRRKENRPPGEGALREAQRLGAATEADVIDLKQWARLAQVAR